MGPTNAGVSFLGVPSPLPSRLYHDGGRSKNMFAFDPAHVFPFLLKSFGRGRY